jgi:hypothetical protein
MAWHTSRGGCIGGGGWYGDWFVGHGGGQLLGRLTWTLRNSESFDLFKTIQINLN